MCLKEKKKLKKKTRIEDKIVCVRERKKARKKIKQEQKKVKLFNGRVF